MGQRVLWVFLGGNMKNHALLVNILVIWSDMSIEKMPRKLKSFWGMRATKLRYRYSPMITVY